MSVAPIRQLKNQSGSFEPFEQDFAYTGNVQSLTIPSKGLYKLEVWGAYCSYIGGKGGYSVGYKLLNRGEIVYIVCGGAGSGADSNDPVGGGYNGGGSSRGYNGAGSSPSKNTIGSGGGATHIATVSGTLPSLSSNTDKVLIVAGGGGGGTWDEYANIRRSGGDGGGLPQGSGTPFGQGASYGSGTNGGGGGGWTGGSGSSYVGSPASGGTGYVGGVPSVTYKGTTYTPSSTSGSHSGNGKAKITRIA